MKVLFVAHAGDLSGGANRSLLSLMERLREAYGVTPCLLIPHDGALRRACDRLGIPVYVAKYHSCCSVYRHEARDALRRLKLLIAPLLDWCASWRIQRRLPRDVDVVYTNERMVAMGGYLARHMRLPHIWHIRSFAEENGVRYPRGWLRRRARNADRVVAISQALYDSLSASIDAVKLRMIYNGIEIDKYSIQEREAHTGYALLLAGRIVPPKGQIDAVTAVGLLARKGYDEIELLLAGEVPRYGENDYKERLDEAIARYGLEDRVRFLGEVEDLSAVRRRVDLELVCSWQETFGRVTIEAMCAGIPVVGSRSGGTQELITERETGLLYRPHCAEDLAEKIEWMYLHRELAEAMGRRGRMVVQENYSIENTARKVYAVLEEVYGK